MYSEGAFSLSLLIWGGFSIGLGLFPQHLRIMTTFLQSLKTNQLVLVSSCTPSGVIFCLLLQSIYLFFSKFWKCEIHFQNFQKYEINIPKFQIVQNYPQIRVYKGSPFYEKWSLYSHMGIAQTAFGYPSLPKTRPCNLQNFEDVGNQMIPRKNSYLRNLQS